jgi:hypothetical protein
MGHVICSVKTGPKQSIVKLNLFNYFRPGARAALESCFQKLGSNATSYYSLIVCVLKSPQNKNTV